MFLLVLPLLTACTAPHWLGGPSNDPIDKPDIADLTTVSEQYATTSVVGSTKQKQQLEDEQTSLCRESAPAELNGLKGSDWKGARVGVATRLYGDGKHAIAVINVDTSQVAGSGRGGLELWPDYWLFVDGKWQNDSCNEVHPGSPWKNPGTTLQDVDALRVGDCLEGTGLNNDIFNSDLVILVPCDAGAASVSVEAIDLLPSPPTADPGSWDALCLSSRAPTDADYAAIRPTVTAWNAGHHRLICIGGASAVHQATYGARDS